MAAVRCSHVLGGKRDEAVLADGQCAALRALPFDHDLKNRGASRTLFRRFPIRISLILEPPKIAPSKHVYLGDQFEPSRIHCTHGITKVTLGPLLKLARIEP